MKRPEMRRPEKELSQKEARKIIMQAKYGVLCLVLDGEPYGVPLSPAMYGNSIYFHCAHEGYKINIIKKNPKGQFVFVSHAEILSEKATMSYRSAMAFGTLRFVQSPEERQTAYQTIAQRYMKDFPEVAQKTIKKGDAKTTLVAMDVEHIKAKGSSMSKKDKKTKKNKKLNISSPITINGNEVKNRIVMPPLVIFNHEREGGFLTDSDYKHYISRAENETGLIVVEATAVDKSEYTWAQGLALWDDKYIDSFKKLTTGMKTYGATVLIQLQHGGYKSSPKLTSPISASDYKDGDTSARGMTEEEADHLVEQFAQAALRAQKAGFDGIELHACHGYLINQFSCPAVNKREDKYAPSSAFGTAIIKRIRELCGDGFIISSRTGIDSPTFENSIQTAMDYQNAGVNILSISAGINTKPYSAPKDWKHSKIAWLAYLVKQKASVPVVAVSGITSRKRANNLLKNNFCDMVAVGRNHLIHADWAKRALNKEEISKCRHCKKGCYFFGTLKKCPAIEKGKKDGYIK